MHEHMIQRSLLRCFIQCNHPTEVNIVNLILLITNCIQEPAEMASSIVKGLLENYVESLVDEGILSDQFSHIQTLTTAEEPPTVEQLINTYCIDVEVNLLQLTSCIDLPNVDFSLLAVLARQVEERSTRIGAELVRLACADLIQACDQMNKKNYTRALGWLKNEFAVTQNKLQAVVKMEQRIMRLELKQQQQQQQ